MAQFHLPEVERANHKAFLQQTSSHSQDHRIIVATSEDGVWMRYDSSSCAMSVLGCICKNGLEVVWVVYATVQWGVISERWYRETVRRLRHEVSQHVLQGCVSTLRLCHIRKRALSIELVIIRSSRCCGWRWHGGEMDRGVPRKTSAHKSQRPTNQPNQPSLDFTWYCFRTACKRI